MTESQADVGPAGGPGRPSKVENDDVVRALRARADAGEAYAAIRLAGVLGSRGDRDGALQVLSARWPAGRLSGEHGDGSGFWTQFAYGFKAGLVAGLVGGITTGVWIQLTEGADSGGVGLGLLTGFAIWPLFAYGAALGRGCTAEARFGQGCGSASRLADRLSGRLADRGPRWSRLTIGPMYALVYGLEGALPTGVLCLPIGYPIFPAVAALVIFVGCAGAAVGVGSGDGFGLHAARATWRQFQPGRLHGHRRAVAMAAFSPSRRLLATGGTDATVLLWDLTDRVYPPCIAALTHQDRVRTVAFSPDGPLLAAGDSWPEMIVWDVTESGHPTQIGTVDHPEHGRTLALAADGRQFVTGCGKAAQLWSLD